MKKPFLTCFVLMLILAAQAQSPFVQRSIDLADPILFGGDRIVYRGDTIVLGPRALFIDGQFTPDEAAAYPFVYHSVNEAALHLVDGSEADPMVLYLAPSVYWIDDPDDPEIRMPGEYGAPYGLVIECEWLKFHGLNRHPGNVVLACNRGQTIGSRGNFTMFRFIGQGTGSENVTFGNYCNVDLVYPLKPELNREKRAPAIVQAQLIHCNGDKILARNTHFISRLNLCPFVGGKRVLFDRCHFESTDDALCATGVYLDCTFEFYSSKPFYWTRETGAVLMNCDITSYAEGNQYFTKAGGQLAVVDTRIRSESATYVGWQDRPPVTTRNYQYNVTFNGEPVTISWNDPETTVEMKGKPILHAYRFEHEGVVVYNTYNLLRGEDDWDPMGIGEVVRSAEQEQGTMLTGIPTQLIAVPPEVSVETGQENGVVRAELKRFGNYGDTEQNLTWSVAPGEERFLTLHPGDQGASCEIIPENNENEPRLVPVVVRNAWGLEGAAVAEVSPSKLDPPGFLSTPQVSLDDRGVLHVAYELDMSLEDRSLVTWYRSSDPAGQQRVAVAVSRLGKPLVTYRLTEGDVGYYILVSVSPKHIRCDPGEPEDAMWAEPIKTSDVRYGSRVLHPDLTSFPTTYQPEVIPGFWTLDSFDPKFTGRDRPPDPDRDSWYYGEGTDGATGYSGLIQAQYARLFYTPVRAEPGDMNVSLTVAPYKSAGQGFSMAPLYMDVLIKFDATTLTGYGLRFIRTTKYHNAVDCVFVKYDHGEISEISEPVSTSCYRSPCFIMLETRGNRLIARALTFAEYNLEQYGPEVLREVRMETEVETGTRGGFGIQYAGGAPTVIEEIRAEWK